MRQTNIKKFALNRTYTKLELWFLVFVMIEEKVSTMVCRIVVLVSIEGKLNSNPET